MYLYFLRTTANLFLCYSFFSIFVFLPVYVWNFDKEDIQGQNVTMIYNQSSYQNGSKNSTTLSINVSIIATKILQKLTVKTSFDNPSTLTFVLLISFIFTLLAFYHIYNYGKKLRRINQNNKVRDFSIWFNYLN